MLASSIPLLLVLVLAAKAIYMRVAKQRARGSYSLTSHLGCCGRSPPGLGPSWRAHTAGSSGSGTGQEEQVAQVGHQMGHTGSGDARAIFALP
jgi:hypothetical protein